MLELNRKALKKVFSGKFKLTNFVKRRASKIILTSAVALTMLTGCGDKKSTETNEPPKEPKVKTESSTPDEKEVKETKKDLEKEKKTIAFLSDSLKISDLKVKNGLDTAKEAANIDVAGIAMAVDEQGNIISDKASGSEILVSEVYDRDVHVASDGDLYVNSPSAPDEISDELDGKYLAPDGSYWESEQDYLNQINGDEVVTVEGTGTTEDVIVAEGDSYRAPDGSYWESKQEYDEWARYNSDVATNDSLVDGEANYYTAPDGSIWESEQTYNEYIGSVNEQTPESDNNYSQDENYGYEAPDGSIWESEQSYNEYINGIDEQVTESDSNYDESVQDDNNYYTAPDGSLWASESDYNDSLSGEASYTR